MNRPPRHEPMLDALRIRLFAARCVRIDVSWAYRDLQNSFWRLYRNDRDGASLALSEGDYPLEGGRLYFVPAGVRFTCRNTREVEQLYIHFDVAGLPPLATRELFGRPILLPSAPALDREAEHLAHALTTEKPVDMLMHCRIKAVLYAGLACYLESVPPERLEHCSRLALALEPILPAIRHIEANLSTPLSNRELAQLCYLSEDHFIRRFRECTGQTPALYVREQRVRLAAQRLAFTDQSIEQIATETGFGNRFYFSRVFARLIGVSPAAYRKTAHL